MIKLLKATVVFGLILGFLSGCATKPGSPEALEEARVAKEKSEVKAVKRAAGEIPNWFTEPPVEGEALYATGVAKSSDMQMGMDRAILAAKRDLAGQINNRLSSKIKEFVSEVGQVNNTSLNREVTSVTKNVVTEVSLAGYRRTKSKMIPEGKGYRVFVLLRYPIGEANKVLVEQINKNNKVRSAIEASKAFKDLEKEIEDARKRDQ